MVADAAALARVHRFRSPTEAIHCLVYAHPAVASSFADLGVHGAWPVYFALRSAPLGRVGLASVVAAFYGWAPRLVERFVPGVWLDTTPDLAVAAREQAMTHVLGEVWHGEAELVTEAAKALRPVVEAVPWAGRPLAAGNAALPWPDDPVLAVWRATTVIREERGDCHVAALVAEGVGPVEAHVLKVAQGGSKGFLCKGHGWTEEEWAEAVESVRARGLCDQGAGALTPRGEETRDRLERHTDTAVSTAWRTVGDPHADRVFDLLERLARPARDAYPADSPMRATLPKEGD